MGGKPRLRKWRKPKPSRYRCRVCDRLVTVANRERHNLKHAEDRGLIVHFTFGGRLEECRPICGAKKRWNTRKHPHINLLTVMDGKGAFNCLKCRRALNKWRREAKDRRKEVMTNVEEAQRAAPYLKTLKNVKKARIALAKALERVGTYKEVAPAVSKAEERLQKAKDKAERDDPRNWITPGIHGYGPMRSRKAKHKIPGT